MEIMDFNGNSGTLMAIVGQRLDGKMRQSGHGYCQEVKR